MRRLIAQIAACLAVTLLAVPALANDGQIAKQIIAQLKQHKQTADLKGFDLGVQVDEGTVTMMGQVASPEQAMLALDTARRVKGVKLVVNDLYVNGAQQAAPMVATRPVARTAMAQPAIRPVAAQQPIMGYQQPIASQYNATGAVGSAVMQQPMQRPMMQQQMQRPMMQRPMQQQMAQRPMAYAPSNIRQASAVSPANYVEGGSYGGGEIVGGGGYGGGGYSGDGGAVSGGNPSVPGYSWPSYAASPNYGAVSYPEQYSATAWPYIGPFYPYPQVPLGWRKVALEWDDGWWNLDFTKK